MNDAEDGIDPDRWRVHPFGRALMLRNWAQAAGFAALLISALVCTFLWVILKPSGPPESSLNTATWVIAFFTALLFLAAAGQAILFLWQLRLIGESVKDTRDAAKAAQDSAETARLTLVALERPWLRLVHIGTNFAHVWQQIANPDLPQYQIRLDVDFMFRNYGKYPAVIKAVFVSLDADVGPPPAQRAGPMQVDGDPVIPADQATPPIKAFILEHALTQDVRTHLRNLDLRIWFFGRVIYQNVNGFGGDLSTEFLWVFDGPNNRFGPSDEAGPERNRCT